MCVCMHACMLNHRLAEARLCTLCCAGDVVELAPKWGAATVDLEQVQVHPTGEMGQL